MAKVRLEEMLLLGVNHYKSEGEGGGAGDSVDFTCMASIMIVGSYIGLPLSR
jgi:hypothetical protein